MNEGEIKVGDRCRIIHYGNLMWSIKSQHIYIDKNKTKILSVDDNVVWYDTAPHLVGLEVIITQIVRDDDSLRYATDKVSWLDRKQLQLLPPRQIEIPSIH